MRVFGIGVVGCGNISATYLRNAALVPGLALRACADVDPAAALERAEAFGLRASPVDALLAADDVDLILNLTVPAAHFDVSMAALAAGKHVFTEKPLGVTAGQGKQLVEEARRRGLAIGSAPDTFLGAAGRLARRLIDDGAIGRPVAGTAAMMTRGMEHWHPNPAFYYQPGGGPVLDMGPYYVTMLVHLLGPVRRVVSLAATGAARRTITAAGARQGTSFDVGTPTTVMAVLHFAGGALVTATMSWDVFRHGQHPIELHGTEGSLRLPDPDTFGGDVALSERGADWRAMPTDAMAHGRINWPFAAPDRANYRMLGVADLLRAVAAGTTPRASGELALHVLEVLEAMALGSGAAVDIAAPCRRPDALSEAEAVQLMG